MSAPGNPASSPTTPGQAPPAHYDATQATTPTFWQNVEQNLDPTMHPLLWGAGALALVALVMLSGKKSDTVKTGSGKRRITISD